MRYRRPLIPAALLLLLTLTAAAAPEIRLSSGSSAMKPMNDWDRFTNDDREYSEILLTEKPEHLQAVLREGEQNPTYGLIRLGPARQCFRLVMGKAESNCIDFLYVDGNGDQRIAADERVEIRKNSPFAQSGYEYQWSESVKPATCQVGYYRANGTIVLRPVTVEFYFLRVKRLGKTPGPDRYFHYYLVNTWFSGTARALVGRKEIEAPIAIIDGDDNGVFNDYGRDFILIDANGNGNFDMKQEIHPLVEFDEAKPDGKTVQQRRKVLFDWPVALAIQPAADPVDWSAVEPG